MTKFLARASARHPWKIIGAWAVLVVIGGILAADAELGLKSDAIDILDPAATNNVELRGSESDRAERLLAAKLGGEAQVTEMVIIQSDSLTVDAPEFRTKVEAVYDDLKSLGDEIATPEDHYYLTAPPPLSLISVDRRTTIIPLNMTGSFRDAERNIETVLRVIEEADTRDDFRVLMAGETSIAWDQNEASERDVRQGERVGVPVALLILVVLFGTLVAAIIPIGLSLAAIVVALGVTALLGQVLPINLFVTLMIVMIGLAVGIDYSILILTRFRAERARGLDVPEAIERASATEGRTVLFSGMTVVIALCGMLLVPITLLWSLGLGAILVVLVALAAMLTFLPASLAILGRHLDRFAVPFLGKKMAQASASGDGSAGGFWDRITHTVMRHPVIGIVSIAAPMILATLFYFQWPGIQTGINSIAQLPEGTRTTEAFQVLEDKFSFGVATPTDIVIDGSLSNPGVLEAMGELALSLATHPGVQVSPNITVNDSADLVHLTVFVLGDPGGLETTNVVTTIREVYIPAAFEGVDADVMVAGVIAKVADVVSVTREYTPLVFVFVLGCSFLLLMLVFRSIVIPLKAVIMNLLSVGTAYGLIVLVFQKGVGADLLGFQQVDIIEAWLPPLLFCVLFGLSLDYHVFLLAHIRERYDRTRDNAEAVAYGMRSTAGMITGAALIMVAVFGAFASGETVPIQQLGFGLTVAILLDATLVRIVLVPASMELLGKRNWYLPSWLQWLPNVRPEAEEVRRSHAR